MKVLARVPVRAGTATIAHTVRADGDMSSATVDAAELSARRRGLVDRPWSTCRQVHGDRVVHVVGPPFDSTPVADGLTTGVSGVVVAVHAADCVPVGFAHEGGYAGVAHAGWKGLHRGVLESTVRRLRNLGRGTIRAVVGPHIRVGAYEFGVEELRAMTRRFGPDVEGRTTDGHPALDLTRAIDAELARLGVEVAATSDGCTASDADDFWSHRRRSERGRIALVAWIDAT